MSCCWRRFPECLWTPARGESLLTLLSFTFICWYYCLCWLRSCSKHLWLVTNFNAVEAFNVTWPRQHILLKYFSLFGFNFMFWTCSMRSEGLVQGRHCGAVNHFVLERGNVAWNGRRPRHIVTQSFELSNTHWLFDRVCVCVCVCEGQTDKRNR